MKIPKDRKVTEAIKRMRVLNIIGDAIEQFRKSGQIMCSEPPMGALYWIDDEQKALVEEFEQKHNAVVYMIIRTYFTEFGKTDAFLYVSDYEEEWEQDNTDIADHCPLVYVYNYDSPEFSEFGCIEVKPRFGGLIRVS